MASVQCVGSNDKGLLSVTTLMNHAQKVLSGKAAKSPTGKTLKHATDCLEACFRGQFPKIEVSVVAREKGFATCTFRKGQLNETITVPEFCVSNSAG